MLSAGDDSRLVLWALPAGPQQSPEVACEGLHDGRVNVVAALAPSSGRCRFAVGDPRGTVSLYAAAFSS